MARQISRGRARRPQSSSEAPGTPRPSRQSSTADIPRHQRPMSPAPPNPQNPPRHQIPKIPKVRAAGRAPGGAAAGPLQAAGSGTPHHRAGGVRAGVRPGAGGGAPAGGGRREGPRERRAPGASGAARYRAAGDQRQALLPHAHDGRPSHGDEGPRARIPVSSGVVPGRKQGLLGRSISKRISLCFSWSRRDGRAADRSRSPWPPSL
jgi:hypothetical protein